MQYLCLYNITSSTIKIIGLKVWVTCFITHTFISSLRCYAAKIVCMRNVV